MSKQEGYIVTPVGKIIFMAAAKPVNKYKSDDTEYTIRLEFEDSTENSEFKKLVSSINDAKILTRNVTEGHFQVKFSSKYQPKVKGPDGEILIDREIPFFNGLKDLGTAKVIARKYMGGVKGTLVLSIIEIHTLERGLTDSDDSSSDELSDLLNSAEAARNA